MKNEKIRKGFEMNNEGKFRQWVFSYEGKKREIKFASIRTFPPINRKQAIFYAKPYVRNNLINAYAIGENN